tara:strand:+ start:1288 stop:2403 length:1116 start_codon:yes stop_codon:yes gene_type:complete
MNLKSKFGYFRNKAYCVPWRILSKLNLYNDTGFPIKYITEDADWAIKSVGSNIKREMDLILPNKIDIESNPSKVLKKIVHFGSQYMWLNWGEHMSKNNRFISTFFHGKPEDGEDVKIHIKEFLKSLPRLSKVVTASTLVEERLLSWDVNPNLIAKIPLGVNTKRFINVDSNKKFKIRNSLNIPKEAIVIGSFQKDGIGWEKGLKPKLIKGPDIFVDTLKLLQKKGFPIYALLTGPARGYVIENLKKYNIPFYHAFVSKTEDLAPFYQALDIYLITSREEGGPMGLIESISCGIPVVSTDVGMARDVIKENISGYISYESNSHEIAKKIEQLLLNFENNNSSTKKQIRNQVLGFDWSKVAKQYWEKVYKDLI